MYSKEAYFRGSVGVESRDSTCGTFASEGSVWPASTVKLLLPMAVGFMHHDR